MQNRKFGRWGELSFVFGTVLLAFGTVLQARADLGLGSAIAPAYVLSEAVSGVAPGTMCYIFYGALVLLTFALLRRFKLEYVATFLSAVFFGMFVNFFTDVFLVDLTSPPLWLRWGLFALGAVVSSLALAFLFNSYFPPQAPEMFAKEVSRLLGWSVYKGKYVFDIVSFFLSLAMSLLFFREVRVIGAGTFVSAVVNGPMITFFGRLLERHLDFSPLFPRVAGLFGEGELP